MTEPREPAPVVDLRIGNAERETAVTRLQAALDDGRLEIAEFDERVRGVYAARTEADLLPLFADLPAGPPVRSAPAATVRAPQARRVRERDRHRGDASGGWLAYAWRAWALAVSINLVIWAIVSVSASEATYFWPMWVAGPWGAVLLVHTLFRKLA